MLRSTTAAKRTCWSPSITTLYLPTFVRRRSVEQAKEFHGEAAARRTVRQRPAFLQYYGSSRDDSRSRRYYCRTTNNHTRDSASSSSSRHESAPETSIDSGEDAYQDYLRAQTRYETLKEEKEREKSRQMFEAWERAAKKQEQFDEDVKKKGKAVSGGVAVVRTLAKQTRKDQEEEQQQHREVYWEQQARKYLEVAAIQLQHPQAQVQLANQLLREVSNRRLKDDEEQRQQLGEQLDRVLNLYRCSGTAEGWFNAGHLLWTGFPDQSAAGAREDDDCSAASAAKEEEGVGATILLSPSFEAAMEAFNEAIALGDADAMYFVGVQQLSAVENNVGQDGVAASENEHLQRGVELINKSALLGHGGALYYKALLQYNGHDALGIPPCGPGAFTEYLDAAVDAGNLDALFLRGHSLYHGDMGYPQDYRRAHSDFVEAAGAGHADAAVSAGAMFYKGYPPHVPRDRARAFVLYQQAGELGSVEGWRNVVSCYALGHGVPQSKAIAKYIAETMLKDED